MSHSGEQQGGVVEQSAAYVAANVDRFMGFAGLYDRVRPQPPAVIVAILTQLARTVRPALVADIGSGTGLSTLIWAEHAEAVVGIEPSADMRREAEARAANNPNIRFHDGLSKATGLPNDSADIVTISQALHWMEPNPTFAEVARILRPEGVFAAIDCDWPPTCHWQAEQAYRVCAERAGELTRERGVARDVRSWNKDEHLERMRSSGQFRYTRELTLHHIEQGNAERLVGLALSQGGIAALLKAGISEDEIGITALREAAKRTLGDTPAPWYWSYRVRIGVK
jgi:SAM-dependent methyltransferase